MQKFIGSLFRTALPLVWLTGCSTLGIKVDSRPENAQRRQAQILVSQFTPSPARDWLQRAQTRNLDPESRLENLLNAASSALPAAIRGDPENREIYNAALAQIVPLLQANQFADQSIAGWRVETMPGGKNTLDPFRADTLIPAASIQLTGLHQRSLVAGIGVPYVFCFNQTNPFLAGQPGVPRAGISVPVTAVLSFHGRTAQLSFADSLKTNHRQIDGHRVPLAADFSAPLGLLVSRSANRSIDIRSFLLTRQRLDQAGLFQYQLYDPRKTPVVFVHGLLSRPEAWAQAVNRLMADPEIRQRYQFWFMMYPTGLSVWQSAALLRSELDRYRRELADQGPNPRLNEIVLIGHSMGGLISSLVVREGGKKLWGQFSDAQLDQLDISSAARKRMEDLIFFQPRRDVSRVIFVAVPHRGSRLAVNPLAGLAARLIRLPQFVDRSDHRTLVGSVREDVRNLFETPANSIRFLHANSPLLTSIQKLPLARRIPYHTIIGDRGRGDSPNSSDGVVPYWSSHLETAVSEKIVPSNHGANENPEGIEEMRRILIEAP